MEIPRGTFDEPRKPRPELSITLDMVSEAPHASQLRVDRDKLMNEQITVHGFRPLVPRRISLESLGRSGDRDPRSASQ